MTDVLDYSHPLDGLELTNSDRLTGHQVKESSCLCLPSVGTASKYYHVQQFCCCWFCASNSMPHVLLWQALYWLGSSSQSLIELNVSTLYFLII